MRVWRLAVIGGAYAVSLHANATSSVQTALTYETTGKPLRIILRELSQGLKSPLLSSNLFANDVIAVRAANCSLDELKAKIAKVEHAIWQKQSGTDVLVQSAEDSSSLDHLHRKIVLNGFAEALKSFKETMRAEPAFGAAQASQLAAHVQSALDHYVGTTKQDPDLQMVESQNPTALALNGVLAAMDPADLADLPLRVRVTYSNIPNAAQRPLAPALENVVDEFISNERLWASELASRTLSTPMQNGVPIPLPSFLVASKLPEDGPLKVLLSFYRESELGRVMMNLQLATGDGKVVTRRALQVRPRVEPAAHAASLPGPSSDPLVPSDMAIGLTNYSDGIQKAEVKKLLLSPESVDPLSVAYGDSLLTVAKRLNVNMVSVLSDRILDGGFRQPRFDKPEQYFEALAKRGQESSLEGGWLEVAPADMAFDRSTQSDRAALAAYLRGSVSKSFSIESQADCALALPDPMENMMPETILAKLTGNKVGLGDWALLRFYGALGDQERRIAASRQGLHLADLPARASDLLNEIIYARTNPIVFPRTGGYSELWMDPSECLANGLDRTSTLYLNIQSEDSVFDLSQDRASFRFNEGSVSAGEVAFGQYQSKHPERFPGAVTPGSGDDGRRYQVGTLKTYGFDFRLARDVKVTATLQGRSLNSENLATLDELPPSFQADVASMYKQIERDEAQFGSVRSTIRSPVPAKP
jgi:hypothetical protein